jgi:signal transduction histidine kinase
MTLAEDREAVLGAVRDARRAPREVEQRMHDAPGRVICLRNFIRYVGETAAGPEYIGVMFDETALRRSREEIEGSHIRLRELADRLQTVREQEQARIAREIHDEMGQMLTGLKLQLSWHARRLPEQAPELVASASEMLSLTDATIDTVRRIATRLRPGVLDDVGLFAALEWLAHDFEHRTGVSCRLDLPARPCAPFEKQATALFRITQEALTNVARHAGASTVAISLRCESDQCVLRVSDDGRGIPVEAARAQRSLGLLGMRERAISSGGDMEIASRPGEGTTVIARVGRRRTSTPETSA